MNQLGPDLTKASYWTEFDEQGERLVMPIKRSWKTVGWAVAAFGFALVKMHAVFEHEPAAFEYMVFIAIIAAALYLVFSIVTSLLAREVIQIRHGDLVHGWRLLGLKREKAYRLGDITHLRVGRLDSEAGLDKLVSPLKDFGKAGVVAFEHSTGTVWLGAALDQAHGQQVVDWIARRAPRGILAA